MALFSLNIKNRWQNGGSTTGPRGTLYFVLHKADLISFFALEQFRKREILDILTAEPKPYEALAYASMRSGNEANGWGHEKLQKCMPESQTG